MIYPWYDENKWLQERFGGHRSLGIHLLRKYAPSPTVVHFRRSYASFRINGFEFARLFPSGKLCYGIKNAPLKETSIAPNDLVTALVKMFYSLGVNTGDMKQVEDWAKSTFEEDVARFIVHALHYHQAEHWLESKLLAKPAAISKTFNEIRSQVVVAYQGARPSQINFIDLLALDNENKHLWVIELKAVRATVPAVSQANAYAKWVDENIHHLLDYSNAYFNMVEPQNQYRTGIMFIAPSFSSNFEQSINEKLSCYPTKILKINSNWWEKIEITLLNSFSSTQPIIKPAFNQGMSSETSNIKGESQMWELDSTYRKLVEMAAKYDLHPREPKKYNYVNLCLHSSTGPVKAQCHISVSDSTEKILVIGDADEHCPSPKHLRRLSNFEILSGDIGPNRLWLRAEGKTFRHRSPAQLYLLPDSTDASEAWKDVEQLINYAIKKEIKLAKARFKSNSAIITHGDVDGMVCAAQLIRREKANCDLVFSNAKGINSCLSRILKSKKTPKRIYVTDIPANPKTEKILGQLVKNGVEVFWIDHHPWPDGLKTKLDGLCTCLVYNEGMNTPAGVLTGKWLKKEDPYYDQIGRICYAYEKGTDWERKWFRLLASYIGKSDRMVLERLAYNRKFAEDDILRIEQQKRSEQLADEILRKAPSTLMTQSNKQIAIYDTSQLEGVYLGRKVFKHHDVDLCLIRISEIKWQLASNPSSKHSMKSLLGRHEIDSLTFSIAGRENELLAIDWEGKRDHSNSHECLIKWLCDRL